METDYSIQTCRQLESRFADLGLHRPMQVQRYDNGTTLMYDVTSVYGAEKGGAATVHCFMEKFVGGGFAGQVYKVRIDKIDGSAVRGLETGKTYAMKILIPPSGGSLFFRNALYGIGFQGPFQLQINPAAARAGALWQKFIRRGAKLRFGDENAVNDIHATFVDHTLGSCGELSDWIDGRTWRLEVDQYCDVLHNWKRNRQVETAHLGSVEYRTKKQFMAEFVKLLHDMGAWEFARQYEWTTLKSQPNALKRNSTENDPSKGLVAVDFRAGLALLPFLPMSPGDIKLILSGIGRGSLVQFDRGSITKLKIFVDAHKQDFSDMEYLIGELESVEQVYRNSVPDVTHNHIRLLYSTRLWASIFDSAVSGWRVKNTIDSKAEQRFRSNTFSTLLFMLIGFIPFCGKLIRRVWGREDYRKHYGAMLSSIAYLKNSIYGKIAETCIRWHRAGRIHEKAALAIARSMGLFMVHLPLSFLPLGMHKALTSWDYFKKRLHDIFVRPIQLYFDQALREQWLRDMVLEGQQKHIITQEDADEILSKIKEPFIQKYLKSLAVHVCTLPVTQVVSFSLAIIYVLTHPEVPKAQAWAVGAAIIALFQVIPISPGSLARGSYSLYLVLSERNFKDYNIALCLSFFKYIGYLAFPIQMAYRYPTLARFMAGHWATEAVHIVPVFGENGALLEHGVFYLFYNWPLTLRRRFGEKLQKRANLKPRFAHAALYAFITAALFGLADYAYLRLGGALPTLKQIGVLAGLLPLCCGALISLGCGGASTGKRVIAAVLSGFAVAILYMATTIVLQPGGQIDASHLAIQFAWRMFVFGVFSAIGALAAELR